ncbi:MAG: S8 family peptidase [Bacteroidota bacterium]
MRKSFFFLILLFLSIGLFAQSKISINTRIFINDVNIVYARNKTYVNKELCDKYPINKFKNGYYVSCLALVNKSYSSSDYINAGILIGSQTGKIITLRIPIENFDIIKSLKGIDYIEIAGKIKPTLDRAVKDTRVDSVWQGIDLPQPFTGKDVLIGITDWGFDYTNPMFYDTTLTHTRIVKAWDQYRNSGPPPTGFNYGTEINGETDLLAAQCDTFNIYEWATHGSHVAGICGGSGAGTVYRGVAFEAQYLMATFLVDAAAVIDAYNWMLDYAQSVGKRLVINQSWGLYWAGNLDGSSLLSQAIDQLSSQGVVFVASAGNNGNVNFHLKHSFLNSNDTLKTVVGFDNYSYYPNMWGQSVSIWGDPLNSFNVSLQIMNTSNVILANSPVFSTNDTASYTEGHVIIGTDTVFYNLSSDSANPLNNRPHMRIRIKNLNTGVYKIALFANGTSGTINCWNVIELTNDVGNWGLPFSAALAGWTNGDYYCGVGEPACTESVISVAAHNSEIVLTGGNVVGGAIAYFSSYGPTYDGRLKPDISAPGASVCSSVSSFTNQVLSGMITSVDFNSRNYKFYKFSGTSMSSPMVTGIVALLLQASPTLTPNEIKNIIKITAREDVQTGNIPDTGSYRWGWGKINAWRAVKTAATNINEQNGSSKFLIYPNPSNTVVNVFGDVKNASYKITIYNTVGEIIFSDSNNTTGIINIEKFPEGIYFIEIKNNECKSVQKLVKY